VQEMAHCAQNSRKLGKKSTAMVAGRSLENQWTTMELNKILADEELRGNQHMS